MGAWAQVDPGPRSGPTGAGGPFPTLNASETAFFNGARQVFQEIDSVSGGVAELLADETFESVVARAGEMVRLAREHGSNRVA